MPALPHWGQTAILICPASNKALASGFLAASMIVNTGLVKRLLQLGQVTGTDW